MVCDIAHGHYVTSKPCIYCGHDEYFWFDYIEHKLGKSRPKIKCDTPTP